jgi:hypothetical protein
VRARWVAVAAALACAAFVAAACRQVLGVSDLQVDAGGGEAGEAAPLSGCNNEGTTFEDCYSCCSRIDGGDPNFFLGALQPCACTGCMTDCPNFCDSGAGSDPPPNCDICVFDSFRGFGSCKQQAATNGADGGSAVTYACIQGCPSPTSFDCSKLGTLRECYDCCEANDPSSTSMLFGAPAQGCVCDAGCGSECSMNYCPNGQVDTAACTRCTLQSLIDGGCAGVAPCSGACPALSQCLQSCVQAE